MAEPALNLDKFLAAFPFLGVGAVPLKRIADEHRQMLSAMDSFDPLRLAATFGGLLAIPELQSNCVRLEALVHLSLALGRGNRKPNDKIISRLFSSLGSGTAGHAEDPAEDVFVSLIRTPRGNFRELEGIWESAGFYLQRVINALEFIPNGARYDYMRESVYALLRLSDAVCERANLSRYQLGNAMPENALTAKIMNSLGSLRRMVRFSEAELTTRGISIQHLAEFSFNPETRAALAEESIGHSSLERYPVARRNTKFFLLLPTAVSVAIRRYVVEEMEAAGLREAFAKTVAVEYMRLLSETALLGLHSGAPVEFQRTEAGLLAGAMTRVDRGLYINFVFFVDTLEGFGNGGLIGIWPDEPQVKKLAEDVDIYIDRAYNEARKMADFRECLTVLVGCGIGRGIVNFFSDKKRDNWRFQFVGASELLTLSWLPEFKALSLWRLLESQDRLEQLGVTLQNMNGLLNMVGWMRSLDGHLVPHGSLPEHFGADDTPAFVVIEQNALLKIRHEVATQWDAHVIEDMSGRWIKVRKLAQSLFEEDRETPLYAVDEQPIPGQWPQMVYESATRPWWVQLETPQGTSGHWAYERSQTLSTWLCRMVPVLEDALPELPRRPLAWRTRFQGPIGDRKKPDKFELLNFEEAVSTISVEAIAESARVTLVVEPKFEDAIFHPENIAERALVARAVEGFARLAGRSLPKVELDSLVQRIVRSPSARHSHAFAARRFRDYVRKSVWDSPIKIDTDDAALIKLGLGWRARDRKQGGDIRGKEACTAYLNAMVRLLEDELCEDLQQLDRRAVIMFALLNHETAISERDNWRRTAAAALALHNDKEAALATIARHEFELNAVFLAARLLIEIALCECPLTGGRKPGRLDMSRLMARVMQIVGLGGWSDAIHWDAMEPQIRITPLGDIHANVTFHDEVIGPYGRVGSDLTIQENVKNYAENLEEPEIRETDTETFPVEFNEALEEQFGTSWATIRLFVDAIENLGIKRKRAIFNIKKSELIALVSGETKTEPAAVAALVEFLTLRSRPRWREAPEGYDEKDLFPWRFRRRLTILRKPLIQFDGSDDPTILVTPGALRDALVYMIRNYHQGDFPLWQLKPKMKQWAGTSRNRLGGEFSHAVAKRLEELGWKTETEVPVTKLLCKGFDQNYGDVDVLAWREDSKRVLIIECKHVQHRKSEGEIAEQLADFRGELDSDNKPDHLLRHLNRMEVISAHPSEVANYIGFDRPRIEGHLVFKNPVPMKFAWKRMESRIALHLLTDLDKI